jgi:hypothetical protein
MCTYPVKEDLVPELDGSVEFPHGLEGMQAIFVTEGSKWILQQRLQHEEGQM